MKPYRIIFVHGYTASHLADWYPAITPMLENAGVEFAVPDMPGGDQPRAADWLEAIDREMKKSDQPLVFVGHSLGTRAVLLYLEKFRPKNVRAVFLIAAFADRTENARRKNGEAYPDFFIHTIDIESIRILSPAWYVIHSADDDSIAYEQGKEISGQLSAKLFTLHGRGHMYDPSDAPVIFGILQKELQFTI